MLPTCAAFVVCLEEMDESGRAGVTRCAKGSQVIQSRLIDHSEPEWVEVDLNRVRVGRSRQFGELLEQLVPQIREEVSWAVMGLWLVLGRRCHLARIEVRKRSVSHTAEHQAILLQWRGLELPPSIAVADW